MLWYNILSWNALIDVWAGEGQTDAKGGTGQVDIMQFLRIVFVIMLCVPVAYIAYILLDQLLDQARQSAGASGKSRNSKRKGGRGKSSRRSR